MPITPTYPGVDIEEIPSSVRTITGVATSITAFVGRTLRGPENEPVTVNSFADFERIFGRLGDESTVGYAVRDFYLNRGSQAIVVRLFHPSFATDAERQTTLGQARTQAQTGADAMATAARDAAGPRNADAASLSNAAQNTAGTAQFPSPAVTAANEATPVDPRDAAERQPDAVDAMIKQPSGAHGTSHPVGLAGRAAAGPVAHRQLLPTTTVTAADRGTFVVLGLRAGINAAAREFAVPPELVGAIVLHESQASERSFFGGAGLADLAESTEAFVSFDPSIGIGQIKLSLTSSLRTRHRTLAGGGSVVGDLLDRARAMRYVAAHFRELGGQMDSWLASRGVRPIAEERWDLSR